MKPVSRRSKHERGQVSIELLLSIMILAVLFFGGFELARGIAVKHALDVGVSNAARGLSLDPTQWGWADTLVRNEVNANVMGGGLGDNVVLRVFDGAGNEITPATLAVYTFGSQFRLRAEVPFQAVAPFVSTSGRTISADHWVLVERYP